MGRSLVGDRGRSPARRGSAGLGSTGRVPQRGPVLVGGLQRLHRGQALAQLLLEPVGQDAAALLQEPQVVAQGLCLLLRLLQAGDLVAHDALHPAQRGLGAGKRLGQLGDAPLHLAGRFPPGDKPPVELHGKADHRDQQKRDRHVGDERGINEAHRRS